MRSLNTTPTGDATAQQHDLSVAADPRSFAEALLHALRLAGPVFVRLAIPGLRKDTAAQRRATSLSDPSEFQTTILNDACMLLRHLQRHEVIEHGRQLLHIQQTGYYRLLSGQRSWVRFESTEQALEAVTMSARSMNAAQRAQAIPDELMRAYRARGRATAASSSDSQHVESAGCANG